MKENIVVNNRNSNKIISKMEALVHIYSTFSSLFCPRVGFWTISSLVFDFWPNTVQRRTDLHFDLIYSIVNSYCSPHTCTCIHARALLSHQQGIHPFCGEIKNVYLVEIESFRSTSSEEYTRAKFVYAFVYGIDDKLIKWIWVKILKYYRFYGTFISRVRKIGWNIVLFADLTIDEIKLSMTFCSFEHASL